MKNLIFKNPIWSALAIAFTIVVLYARLVEPIWIEVTRHSIRAEIKKPLLIAHISDLHIRSIGHRESKILQILETEKPDVVLVTGDSVTDNGNYHSVNDFLGKIRAPLGVWTVDGNWEHWRPSKDVGITQSPNIRHLKNAAAKLTEKVWIVGLDDEFAGNPDLAATIDVPNSAFKIGLFHSPSFFEKAFKHFELALAGHTHGGQIRIPFLPPVWLPEGSGNFVAGWYKRGRSQMYVSRGLGNSILEVRFFCRPEVALIKLEQ